VGEGGTILKMGDGGSVFIEEHKPTDANFRVSPNPANDKITINSERISNEEIDITILTIRGEQVLKEKFYNQNPLELSVSNLIKGIYLIKIEARAGVEVKKLVIY
jgi:hypothetical protein